MPMVTLRAGQKIRFRVEDTAGRAGFSWTVDTRPGGDVYLFCREASKWMHTSLHASGRWHHAVTDKGQEVEPETDGYLDLGRSRQPFAPGLWLASRVWVPVSELRPQRSPAPSSSSVVLVPPAEGFDAVYLEVFLEDAGAARVLIEKVFPIALFKLPEGRTAHVIARPVNTRVDVHAEFADVVRQAEEALRTQFGWDGSPSRIAIVLPEDDQSPTGSATARNASPRASLPARPPFPDPSPRSPATDAHPDRPSSHPAGSCRHAVTASATPPELTPTARPTRSPTRHADRRTTTAPAGTPPPRQGRWRGPTTSPHPSKPGVVPRPSLPASAVATARARKPVRAFTGVYGGLSHTTPPRAAKVPQWSKERASRRAGSSWSGPR